MAFRLLCCDGGGIRGIITAMLIQDLDNKYGIIASANGFSGTSTGGLIALALANGISIADILSVYQNDGQTIFTPNDSLIRAESRVPVGMDSLGSGPGFFSCAYTNSGLIQIADQLLGTTTLGDVTKYISVNSAQLWDGTSWSAQTLSNSGANSFGSVAMAQAALATSAAPTYFPPYEIDGFGFFADGGVFANNPTMAALADLQQAGIQMSEVVAISLGTGLSPSGIAPSSIPDPLSWGTSTWMWPWNADGVPATALMNLMFDATQQAATVQSQQLLGNRMVRGNVTLSQAYPLDNWEDIQVLIDDTNAYMATAEWQSVCSWVNANW